MDEKLLFSDFLVKSTNLCGFLLTEKKEELLSKRLFEACCSFSEYLSSTANPSITKAEVSSLRKSASLEADKITLYLSALFSSGFISSAQSESMLRSLDAVKKQINI